MDIVFAIDSSENIADSDLELQAAFFKKLAAAMDVQPEGTRVGALQYSDQIQEMFDLVEYDTLDGVQKGLQALGMTAGGTRVDLALRHILTRSFR